MTVPASPTLVSLVEQGLAKAGYDNPTPDMRNEAQDHYVAEIKNDIWMLEKKLKPLHTKSYDVTIIGQDLYPAPTDYSSGLSVTLLEGTVTGTAQAGAVGTITLAAADTATESEMLGKTILITGGTGVNQASQCVGFSTTTKVATVEPDFTTAPDNTSTYLRVDQNTPLPGLPAWDADKQSFSMNRDKPTHHIPIGDSDDGEFILRPVPDKVYGIQYRYYLDLMELDLAGTLMTTLYKRWRNVFVYGVYAKRLEMDAVTSDDERALRAMSTYRKMIKEIKARDGYTHDISDMTMTVNE